ncbi:hypothetical protein Rhe02_74810 [Rhizocola hellebori]|uniref:Secreted protein n=1 Tax=Rhizocola hellebori TaxID=1392758 RepID=A0A8J3VJG8_9ACTN|nr:hypothetical protein [Rhizocola hellebori]GIH09414.1 hypothetical protein Rhe02_74810 [Rhizocola hellebori]
MRLKLAFVAALAMLGTVFVAPSPALAAPDSIACSAAGSYSRIIGFPGTPTTFWLVGTVGTYRYWHVVLPTSSGGETYSRSYVVRCSGTTIAWSADLTPFGASGDRCGTTSTLLETYVGVHSHSVNVGGLFLLYNYRYWHIRRWQFDGTLITLVYDHSEVARCLF